MIRHDLPGEGPNTAWFEKLNAFEQQETLRQVRFKEGLAIVGSALVCRKTVIHVAFFRTGEDDRAGRMCSATSRRRFRL